MVQNNKKLLIELFVAKLRNVIIGSVGRGARDQNYAEEEDGRLLLRQIVKVLSRAGRTTTGIATITLAVAILTLAVAILTGIISWEAYHHQKEPGLPQVRVHYLPLIKTYLNTQYSDIDDIFYKRFESIPWEVTTGNDKYIRHVDNSGQFTLQENINLRETVDKYQIVIGIRFQGKILDVDVNNYIESIEFAVSRQIKMVDSETSNDNLEWVKVIDYNLNKELNKDSKSFVSEGNGVFLDITQAIKDELDEKHKYNEDDSDCLWKFVTHCKLKK